MAATLFGWVEATAATLLANGRTMLAYGESFGKLTEGGSDKFVQYCAQQGCDEAEADRYGAANSEVNEGIAEIASRWYYLMRRYGKNLER